MPSVLISSITTLGVAFTSKLLYSQPVHTSPDVSPPLSGISGLSFDSTFMSALVILPSSVAPSVLLHFLLLAHSPASFPEIFVNGVFFL